MKKLSWITRSVSAVLPHLAALFWAISVIGITAAHAADVTFNYTSQPFDPALSGPNYVPGKLLASVVVKNMPSNFTGRVDYSIPPNSPVPYISSYSLTAYGNTEGSFSPPPLFMESVSLELVNGLPTQWTVYRETGPTAQPSLTFSTSSTFGDGAKVGSPTTAQGSVRARGVWSVGPSSPPTCTANPGTPAANLLLVDPFLLAKKGQDLSNIDLANLLPKAKWAQILASGLVADNASAVIALVQTNSHDCVTFSTDNGTTITPYTSGFLTTPPALGAQTMVVPANDLIQIGAFLYAAVLVQAPATGSAYNFGAPVTVTARQDTTQKQAAMSLNAPPVVLVHGLWGTQDSLSVVQSALKTREPWRSQNTQIDAIEYNGAQSFYWPDANGPAGKLDKKIGEVLKNLDQQHIVGSRVDIVAHSMGGLVSKYYSSLSSYRSSRDRQQGRFHEIITLDTPEDGSALAPFLIQNRSKQFNLTTDFQSSEVWRHLVGCSIKSTVEECFSKAKMPLTPSKGAAIESSGVYSLVPPAGFCPSQDSFALCINPHIPNAIWRAISATRPVGPDVQHGESLLEYVLQHIIAAVYPAGQSPSMSDILHGSNSAGVTVDDVVVTLDSQLGAKSGRAVDGEFVTLPGIVHDPLPHQILLKLLSAGDTTAQDDPRIIDVVSCWLRTSGRTSCGSAANASSAVSRPALRKLASRASRPKLSGDIPGGIKIAQSVDGKLASPIPVQIELSRADLASVTVEQEDATGHYAETQVIPFKSVLGSRLLANVTPMLLGPVRFSFTAVFKDGSFSTQDISGTVAMPDVLPKNFVADVNVRKLVLTMGKPFTSEYTLTPKAYFKAAPTEPVDVSQWTQYRILPTAHLPVLQISADGHIRALQTGEAVVEVQFGSAISRIKVDVELPQLPPSRH